MRPPASQRLRRLLDEPLLANGLYIMGKTAVPALLGFGFWIIAARALPAEDVGQGAALVSAMLLVSVLTNLGIGQVYISRLGGRPRPREWALTVSTGLLVAGAASLAGGAAAALALAAFLPALDGAPAAVFALLPLGVAAAAWFLLLDHVFVAERDARPAFARNAGAALARLALIAPVALLPVEGVTWLVAAWVASFLIFDAIGVLRTVPRFEPGFRPTLGGWREELSEIRHLIAGHHAINLGAQTTAFVLPLLVAARLGPEQNAYFYATFLLASSITFIAPAISDSLFAEGAHRPQRVERDLRRAIRHTAMLALPPAIVLLVAGPPILSAFGSEYSDAGAAVLRILVGAAAFNAGMILAIGVLRVRGRLLEGAAATFGGLAVAVVATWLMLPSLGLEGAGYGWALGSATGMAIAAGFVVWGERGAAPLAADPVAESGPGQKARRV